MAKPKSAEEIEREKREQERRDMIRKDHQRLKDDVTKANDDRSYVRRAISAPAMSNLLNKFKQQIDENKEDLTKADAKEVIKIQSLIAARRGLLSVLNTAYEEEVCQAERKLREFEQQNALFLQNNNANAESETVNTETGEVKTA
jgi:hypothetical protein